MPQSLPEGFQGCSEAKTHCCSDRLPGKGPVGAWSVSWEQCEWWGHTAPTPCWPCCPTLLPSSLPSGQLCCEDLGPPQHSILSFGGVHGKKAGTDPCIFTSARLPHTISYGQGRLRLERAHVVQSRGKDFSASNVARIRAAYPWKQPIHKLEVRWRAGLLFELGATAARRFWCLKSTFIFSLSTSESQVSLLTTMLGYLSLFLFSIFTLAAGSQVSLCQRH